MTTHVVLVGELNPYAARDERFADKKYDLYPHPPSSAGGRLRRILGLSLRDYLALDRRNLCRGKWSIREARVRAVDIAREFMGGVVVMCGHKVASAFRFDSGLFTGAHASVLTGDLDPRRYVFLNFKSKYPNLTLVSIPHPSGRCREWNDPGAVARVRDLLCGVAPDVRWGLGCLKGDPCLLPRCGFCGGPS